jgi:hypothetical protein
VQSFGLKILFNVKLQCKEKNSYQNFNIRDPPQNNCEINLVRKCEVVGVSRVILEVCLDVRKG